MGILGYPSVYTRLPDNGCLTNSSFQRLHLLVNTNHGDIIPSMCTKGLVIHNALHALKRLLVVHFHVTYHVTARKYMVRMDNGSST